tara:strand:- start:309 stop:722 length:414 start_codon:yes stop_codon:yes gene_type:complete
MRKQGKSEKNIGYKEIVTKGLHPYKLPITDARGKTTMVEFVATLVELVPDHKPCDSCGKYLGDLEIEMSTCIISCDHKNFIETKINDRVMKYECPDCGGNWGPKPDSPYWEPVGTQEFMCFECYEQILQNEKDVIVL